MNFHVYSKEILRVLPGNIFELPAFFIFAEQI